MSSRPTPFDEDFREMIVESRDAVLKLLDESDHDSWLQLRIGYATLRDALRRDDKLREHDERWEQRMEKDRERDERYVADAEAEDVWRRMPAATRESLLLNVLGDERLIIRQLVSRVNAELGQGSRSVYTGNIRSLVTRMLRSGQLEREAETFNKTHMRYRYFRKRTLDGPIIDLERAYQEGDER